MTPPLRRRAGFLRRWPSRRAEDQPGPPDPGVQLGDLPGRRAMALGALPGPLRERREVPLRLAQLRGHRGEESRVGDVLAVRGGQEVGDARVDADHRPRGQQGLRGHAVAGEDDVPAGSLALHRDRLDPAAHGPVLAHPDVPDTLEPYACPRIVGGGVPSAAVAALGEGDGVEVPDALEAGVSRALPGLDPAEERLERLVQSARGGLLGGERPTALTLRIEYPDLLELGGLVPVADRGLRGVPVGVTAFLEGAVVQGAVVPQHLAEHGRLTGRGAQEELVRADHRSRLRSTRSPSARRTHAAALIEMPTRSAYASICRFSSGATRRFIDSRRSPLATTKIPPLRDCSSRAGNEASSGAARLRFEDEIPPPAKAGGPLSRGI